MSNGRKLKQAGGNHGAPRRVHISDAVPINCTCGCPVFSSVQRLSSVSKLVPSNNTGQDILLQQEVFLCVECGKEFVPNAGVKDGTTCH